MEEILKKIGLEPLNVLLSFSATVLHLIVSDKIDKKNRIKYILSVPLSALLSAYLGPLIMSAAGHKEMGTLCAVLLGFIILDFAKNPRQFIKNAIDLKNKWTSPNS